MKVLGIVVEYNPFHNGHAFHIDKSKELTGADAVVAVMSGNFVQRGIPAVMDKWSRAHMALVNGVDLVLELPVLYSLSSAEFFAHGAISLLNNIGIVEAVCFGSECGDINILNNIASLLQMEPPLYKTYLKDFLKKGFSYPKARSEALSLYLKDTEGHASYDWSSILASPNNTLGIEYCRSILRLGSDLKAFSILREDSDYNSEVLNSSFPSATALRKYMKENIELDSINKHVPYSVACIIKDFLSHGYSFSFMEDIFPYIKYKLMTCTNLDSILSIPDITEGLENRLFKFLPDSTSIDEYIEAIKTKRYTYTRISRILSQIFIGFENYPTSALRRRECPYARVLGFNAKGAELLKNMKAASSIPVYVKLPKNEDIIMTLDIQASKAYSIINKNIDPVSDYIMKPIIV